MYHDLETFICDPNSTKWAIPYLLYQCVWANPSEHKGILFFILFPLFYMNVIMFSLVSLKFKFYTEQ